MQQMSAVAAAATAGCGQRCSNLRSCRSPSARALSNCGVQPRASGGTWSQWRCTWRSTRAAAVVMVAPRAVRTAERRAAVDQAEETAVGARAVVGLD